MTIALRGTPTTNAGSGATTLTISVPSGVVDGDLLILAWGEAHNDTAVTPTGWTSIPGSAIAAGGGSQDIHAFYRIASSEPPSYTITFGSTSNHVLAMLAYSGADGTTPKDTSAAASNSSTSTTMIAPTITTANANEQILAIFGYKNASAFTAPSGMTAQATISSSTLYTLVVCDVLQPAAGASGTKSASILTTSTGVMLTIALNSSLIPNAFWQDYKKSAETIV